MYSVLAAGLAILSQDTYRQVLIYPSVAQGVDNTRTRHKSIRYMSENHDSPDAVPEGKAQNSEELIPREMECPKTSLIPQPESCLYFGHLLE